MPLTLICVLVLMSHSRARKDLALNLIHSSVAHTSILINSLQVHDSVAYSKTSIAKLISEGRLPSEYHIVCDNAYPLGPQALIPFKGTGLRVEQSAYNYFVSLHRQVSHVTISLIIVLEH